MNYCLTLALNDIGVLPAHAFSGLRCTDGGLIVGNATHVQPLAFNNATIVGRVWFSTEDREPWPWKPQASLGVLEADTFSGLTATGLVLRLSGVTGLKPFAFRGMQLTGTLDLGYTRLGVLPPNVFAGATAGGVSLYYQPGITNILPGAFAGCTMCSSGISLSNDQLRVLRTNAFAGLRSSTLRLTRAGITTIEPFAFNDTVSSVSLGGNALGTLVTHAFTGLRGSLTVDSSGVTNIEPYAFVDSDLHGGLVLSGNNIGVLKTGALAGMQAKYVDLENAGVSGIQPEAFAGTVLTSYKDSSHPGCVHLVGNPLGIIPSRAFCGLTCTSSYYSKYGGLHLHSLQGIQAFAFDGCSLSTLQVYESSVGTLVSDTFFGLKVGYVVDLRYSYRSGVSDLEPYAFRNLTANELLLYGLKLGVLPAHAFDGLVVDSLVFSATMTGIAPGAFLGSHGLFTTRSMTFGTSTLGVIPTGAFTGLSARSLSLPGAGVTAVEPYAFRGMHLNYEFKLSDVAIGVLRTGSLGGMEVGSIDVAGAGITEVEALAFNGTVSGDTTLSTSDNKISRLRAQALRGLTCKKLQLGAVGSIDAFAFDGLHSTGVRFADGASVGELVADTFSGLTGGYLSLTHSGYTSIAPYAFRGMKLSSGLHFSGTSVGVLRTGVLAGLHAGSIDLAGVTGLEPRAFEGTVLASSASYGGSRACVLFHNSIVDSVPALAFSGLTCLQDDAGVYLGNVGGLAAQAFAGLTVKGPLYFQAGSSVGQLVGDTFNGLAAGSINMRYSGMANISSYAFRGVSLQGGVSFKDVSVGLIHAHAFDGASMGGSLNLYAAGVTGVQGNAILGLHCRSLSLQTDSAVVNSLSGAVVVSQMSTTARNAAPFMFSGTTTGYVSLSVREGPPANTFSGLTATTVRLSLAAPMSGIGIIAADTFAGMSGLSSIRVQSAGGLEGFAFRGVSATTVTITGPLGELVPHAFTGLNVTGTLKLSGCDITAIKADAFQGSSVAVVDLSDNIELQYIPYAVVVEPALKHSRVTIPSLLKQGAYCIAAGRGMVLFAPADVAVCSDCAPGSYCPAGLQVSVPCPAGTYGAFAGGSDLTACKPCPLNAPDSPAGTASLRGCVAVNGGVAGCPPGYHEQADGMCAPCGVGTFNAVAGATSPSACQPCPPGSFTNATGSAGCSLCPPGYVVDATSHGCVQCAGVDTSAASGVSVCPPGSVAPAAPHLVELIAAMAAPDAGGSVFASSLGLEPTGDAALTHASDDGVSSATIAQAVVGTVMFAVVAAVFFKRHTLVRKYPVLLRGDALALRHHVHRGQPVMKEATAHGVAATFMFLGVAVLLSWGLLTSPTQTIQSSYGLRDRSTVLADVTVKLRLGWSSSPGAEESPSTAVCKQAEGIDAPGFVIINQQGMTVPLGLDVSGVDADCTITLSCSTCAPRRHEHAVITLAVPWQFQQFGINISASSGLMTSYATAAVLPGSARAGAEDPKHAFRGTAHVNAQLGVTVLRNLDRQVENTGYTLFIPSAVVDHDGDTVTSAATNTLELKLSFGAAGTTYQVTLIQTSIQRFTSWIAAITSAFAVFSTMFVWSERVLRTPRARAKKKEVELWLVRQASSFRKSRSSQDLHSFSSGSSGHSSRRRRAPPPPPPTFKARRPAPAPPTLKTRRPAPAPPTSRKRRRAPPPPAPTASTWEDHGSRLVSPRRPAPAAPTASVDDWDSASSPRSVEMVSPVASPQRRRPPPSPPTSATTPTDGSRADRVRAMHKPDAEPPTESPIMQTYPRAGTSVDGAGRSHQATRGRHGRGRGRRHSQLVPRLSVGAVQHLLTTAVRSRRASSPGVVSSLFADVVAASNGRVVANPLHRRNARRMSDYQMSSHARGEFSPSGSDGTPPHD